MVNSRQETQSTVEMGGLYLLNSHGHHVSTSCMLCHICLLQLTCSIRSLGSSLAYFILYDQGVSVMYIYFLINAVLAQSVYLAEIALLGFIQILLCNCFEGAGMSAKAKHAFVVTNWVIINIFIALWATIAATSIRLQFFSIANRSKVTPSGESLQKNVTLAYFIIFLLVGIEIMILSFRIRSGAKQRNDAILPKVSSS